jgi:hypothetical protein
VAAADPPSASGFFESAAADHVGRRSGISLRRAAAQVRQALDFDEGLGLGHVVRLATCGFDQMAHLFENDATLLILTVTHDGLPVGGTNIISF